MNTSYQVEETLKYRNELKYVISGSLMEILRGRIKNLIPRDPHVGPDGRYIIRSLYFDDYNNRCYYENENGTDPREKYRIRIYNYSDARISLECKRKERGLIHKSSCRLTKEQVVNYYRGDIDLQPLLLNNKDKLLNKFNNDVLLGFRPKVIVEYEREPFIYPLGNVRITFDTNIMSSIQVNSFFDKDIVKRSVMPYGVHLLEVKFDEYIPSFIFDTLQLSCLERTAFSKYYLCRKYSL